MKDDKAITQKDIDEASVVLKPILGVEPRRYVPAALVAALLLALFLLLLYPGLKRPGVYYTFVVDPPGSAVFIDGAYAASAPCEVFVAQGERRLRVERPGFAPHEATLKARGRVFATLLARPRAIASVTLAPADPQGALRAAVADYAAWALTGTPSESYQLPMTLSETARAVSMSPGGYDPSGLAGAAASYASHPASLRDAARAVALAYSGSAAPTPATLGRLATDLARELRDDPATLAALAPHLPAGDRARLEEIPAYRDFLSASAAAGSGDRPATARTAPVAGVELVAIGAGTAVVGGGSALPRAVPVEAFRLAARETTVGQWRRFVAARPEWAGSNVQALVAQGLASADYLSGLDEAADGDVLRFVSRPAAQAFCAWLSAEAPRGFRFSLPSEAQWSLAAQAAGASAKTGAVLAGVPGPRAPGSLALDAAGLAGLLGNVWEWCSDSYSVTPAAGPAGRERFPSAEALVRGGSWANRAELVSLASRGPMRQSECSAFVGFRVALVPVED